MRFHTSFCRIACLLLLTLMVVTGGQAFADPIKIAVFGDNPVDNFINGTTSSPFPYAGYTADLVSDGDLSTPGFLGGYSALIYTRDAGSFGTSLSGAAIANILSYIGATGAITLFNGDFTDSFDHPELFGTGIDDAWSQTLLANAIHYAALSGSGFIGELNGALAALTGNSGSLFGGLHYPGFTTQPEYTPLGLIGGTAGPLDSFDHLGVPTTVHVTTVGLTHPITSGLSFPYTPPAIGFGATLTGIDPSLVLATYANGNPAIIDPIGLASSIPEPTTVTLLGSGLLAFFGIRRRKQSNTA